MGAGDTTFTGSRSGAHPGRHTYNSDFKNQPYAKSGKVTMSQINSAIEKAISDPE
ncbi:MAG: hypothetical protein IJ193_08255 [Bacilli bacterium]|nr:hypothetical protein [Bacilli bacterium]